MKGHLNDRMELNQTFEWTVQKWRAQKPTNYDKNSVCFVQALYRQATIGDAPPLCSKDQRRVQQQRWTDLWKHWNKLRGTPFDVAKRRYISYLRSLDDLFCIPSSSTITNIRDSGPVDFCRDTKTKLPICAWCNTVIGCCETLLEENGRYTLQEDFYSHPKLLSDITLFQSWYEKYEQHQRCRFGLHLSISRVEANLYTYWFTKDHIKGFKPYNSEESMVPTLRWVMNQQFQILFDLQQNFKKLDDEFTHKSHQDEFGVELDGARKKLLQQTDIAESFQKFFVQKIGTPFSFEIPCERKSSQCHARRIAAGGQNHTHPIEFIRPTVRFERFTLASNLRCKVSNLGESPITGPLHTEDRCYRLAGKIASNYRKRCRVEQAYLNFCKRTNIKEVEKHKLLQFSNNVNYEALQNAIANGNFNTMLDLISKNSDMADYESKSGITPLIKAAISGEKSHCNYLVNKCRANINYVNSYGMSALSWACKRVDEKMTCTLLYLGADPCTECHFQFNPMELTVRHNRMKVLELIIAFLDSKMDRKEDLENVLNRLSTATGETLMMLCARYFMKRMAKYLFQNGASINVISRDGITALQIAESLQQNDFFDFVKFDGTRSNSSAMYNIDTSDSDAEDLATFKLKRALLSKDNERIVDLLREHTINPDYELECGATLLIWATRQRDIKLVTQLLSFGCDPCYTNRYGNHALIELSFSDGDNDVIIANTLLNYNRYCLNICNLEGKNALFYSSQKKSSMDLFNFLSSYSRDNERLECFNEKNMSVCYEWEKTLSAEDLYDCSWQWRLV